MKRIKCEFMRRVFAILFLSIVSLFLSSQKVAAVSACDALGPFQPLHAEQDFIYDASGRVALLRGVNVPANYHYPFAYNEKDLDIIKSFGFNFIRLGVNWAHMEPEKGKYDFEHVNKHIHFIKEAAKRNIYVMLDFHQVMWCVPGSAVPDWVCGERVSDHTDFMAVLKSADRFWENEELQNHLIRFWEFLVRQFKNSKAVFGYNIMNEPVSSYGLSYGNFEKHYLFPFYAKVISAIRAIDPDKPVILEPSGYSPVLRNYTEPLPFKNLIYSPHPYFLHTYGKKGELVVLEKESLKKLQRKYARHVQEAKKMNVPLLVGEFGAPESLDFIEGWFSESLRLLDAYFLSWSFWTYNPQDSAWSVVDSNRTIRDFYWKKLRRPYPMLTPGKPVSFSFEPQTGEFLYVFQASTEACGPAVVFIPREIMEASRLKLTPERSWHYDEKEQNLIIENPRHGEKVSVALKPK